MLVLMLAEGMLARRGLVGTGLEVADRRVVGREQHAALQRGAAKVER